MCTSKPFAVFRCPVLPTETPRTSALVSRDEPLLGILEPLGT